MLFDFDIKQDQRVHAKIGVLAHAIVEAVGPPCVGEKDEGDGLAKVVQLQAARPDRVHNGRVVYDTCRYAECTGAEEDVRVGSGAKRIAHDEERNVLDVRISQDLVTLSLDHVAVGKNKGFAIELLLQGGENEVEEAGRAEMRRTKRSFRTVRMLVYASRYRRVDDLTA